MELTTLRISEIFDQDIHRTIDPVVQIQATSHPKLAQEINEYVVTDAIREHFTRLLDNYLALQRAPNQKVGIWVSGFFGSGKSSFAKMLAYALENRDLGGERVRTGLLRRFGGDARIQELCQALDELEQHRPTRIIVFDMAIDAARNKEFISEVMYAQLLEHFNYPADLALAELELQLEREGNLERFEAIFQEHYNMPWSRHKRDATARSRASAVMHQLEPQTYSSADSWARTRHEVALSPAFLANRAVEMAQRRGDNANLMFVIDEVGQFASRSEQRMLDLQGVVQAFYEGGTRAEPGSGVTPGAYQGRLWLMVTSQERLDAVVENLESHRSELQRLQDRFQNPVDLKPTDITEVIKQRLLKKKSQLEPNFKTLYETHEGALKLHSKLEAGYQRELNVRSFTDLYPLLPYQFDVIIDVIGTIRSQGHAGATYGAAVRPILAMVSDLLNSDALQLRQRTVGKLITFDEVYDILVGKLRADISDSVGHIQNQLGASASATRVAKALVLLSMAKGIKRTLRSVAAVLYPHVGHGSIDNEVRAALEQLQSMERVGYSDGQYDFLSQEARDWESERNQIDPGNKRREEVRKILARDLANQSYTHKGLKTFKPTLLLDGTIPTGYGRGDIELRLDTLSSDPSDAYQASQANPNAVCGVISLTRPIEDAATQLLRSRTMIERFERDDSRSAQVTRERQRAARYENNLETELHGALTRAPYYFRGQALKPETSNLNKLIEALFAPVVEEIFHKLSQLTIRPSDSDLKALFTQSNLAAMNELLGPSGLNVLQRQGGQTSIDADASIFQDLQALISQRYDSGQSATGRDLEQHFGDAAYGWSVERVRYLSAVYFRAGALELHAQGERFTSWNDPGAQDVFTSLAKFRQAQFAPRLDKPDVMGAINLYMELTGDFIEEPDEAVVAGKVRSYANTLANQAQTIVSRLEAQRLPGADTLKPVADALNEIRSSNSSEDVIKLFLGNGQRIKAATPTLDALHNKLTGATLTILQSARSALERYYPAIPTPRPDARAAKEKLERDLASESFYDRLAEIQAATKTIQDEIAWAYHLPWRGRYQKYQKIIEALGADPGFQSLSEDEQEAYHQQLLRHQGDSPNPPEHVLTTLDPTIDHLTADTYAADNRLRKILEEIRKKLAPKDNPPVTISLRKLNLQLEPEDDQAMTRLDTRLQEVKDEVQAALEQGQRVVLE